MARPRALKRACRVARLSDPDLLRELDAELQFGWGFQFVKDNPKLVCAYARDDTVEGYGSTMRAACEALLLKAIARREKREA